MNKKEAIKEFKNRKIPRGIFVVRCTQTGDAWVDSARDLGAAKNGIWHFLRHGDHHNPAMQKAWNQHGEESFQFEIVEKLDDDLAAIGLNDALKERKLYWIAALSASAAF